jgi:hypothetical protein
MRGHKDSQKLMWTLTSPKTVVPRDHPIRPLKALVDEPLASLNPVFEKMYSDVFSGGAAFDSARALGEGHAADGSSFAASGSCASRWATICCSVFSST